MTEAKKAAIVTTVRLVITSTATLGCILAYNVHTAFLLYIECKGSSLQLVESVLWLVLLLLLCSTFFAVLYYRKSYVTPPSGGYDFVQDPGYYFHRKTAGHFCNPCLSKGFASRLSIHHKDGYMCRLCKEVYIGKDSGQAEFDSRTEDDESESSKST